MRALLRAGRTTYPVFVASAAMASGLQAARGGSGARTRGRCRWRVFDDLPIASLLVRHWRRSAYPCTTRLPPPPTCLPKRLDRPEAPFGGAHVWLASPTSFKFASRAQPLVSTSPSDASAPWHHWSPK